MSWQAGGWSVAIDALVKNFERQHPDIGIKTDYAPIPTYGQVIQTQFQAGNGPDLVSEARARGLLVVGALITGIPTLTEGERGKLPSYMSDLVPARKA